MAAQHQAINQHCPTGTRQFEKDPVFLTVTNNKILTALQGPPSEMLQMSHMSGCRVSKQPYQNMSGGPCCPVLSIQGQLQARFLDSRSSATNLEIEEQAKSDV